MRSFTKFVCAPKITIETYDQPLIDKELNVFSDLSLQLQRLLLSLKKYDYTL